MTLNRRYKRDLKHNMSLYVSATLLTVISLLLFYLYYISGAGIIEYTEDIFEKQKIEDAHFSTYIEIPSEEIKTYEEKYNITLEKQEYINIETGGISTRVFEKNKKADIPFITEGIYPEKNNQVAISEGYAVENNKKIGDIVKIREKDYIISGYIERPDYLYMLQNLNDNDKNVTSFFICYMTDEEFKSLGDKTIQYLAIYNDKSDTESFRKDINEKYIMSGYVEAEKNHRIIMLTDQPDIFITMAYAVLFTLPLMAVILISIILSRKIKNEQKMIGTLAAYGYSKRKIIKHYAGFSAIPGIMGGILTTIVISLIADDYGALGLMDYEPLKIDFKLAPLQMVMGILIPTIMYILSTTFTVNRLLKHNITELLSGSVKGNNKGKKFFVGKKVSFRTKFSVRSIIGNKGRTFALFLGVFLGAYVILWGMISYDTIANIGNATVESMGEYNYQYNLNELKNENPYGGETLLLSGAEDKYKNQLVLFGADDNSLIQLKDLKGKPIEVNNKYIATSLYSEITGIEAGDSIKVKNPLSMEEYDIKIDKIAANNFASAIYTSRENVSEMSGIEADKYNAILSKEKLTIPEDKISSIISRDQIDDQYKSVIDQMDVMINAFIIIGLLLCIVSVYVAVNMIITENKVNISMLGVLGYDEKKINRLLIRDNIFVVIIAAILSIPAAIWSADALFTSFTDILGYLIEIKTDPSSYIISIVLVLISYMTSVFFVKRKINKIDIVDSLKDNRD